jgi:hypothetical protein
MTASATGIVLVITTTIDLAADRVVEKLLTRSVPVFRLNTDRLPYLAEVSVACSPGSSATIRLREAGRTAHSDALVAYWYRRVRMPARPADVVDESHEYVFREAIATLRGALDVLSTRCRSFGSATALERAESKVVQLNLAEQLGFEIPATLIASDPAEIRDFAANRGGAIVAKPVHSGYLRTATGDVGIFTECVRRGIVITDSTAS